MRKTALFLVTLLIGCTPTEDAPPAETPAEAAVETPSFAGTWTIEVMPMDSDSVLVTGTMNATDTPDGWSLTFDHLDEPVRANSVVIEGDMATVEYGPYPSALREGATVTSLTTVATVSGDEFNGTFSATYDSGEPGEGRIHGSRQN